MSVVEIPTREPASILGNAQTEFINDAEVQTAAAALSPTVIWDVPFSALTFDAAIREIDRLIRERTPSYFITANLHYVMLTSERRDMADLNQQAAFILADGMPIVWRSRLTTSPLPERIAGADLIYAMAELAAQRHYRVFFLGGAEGVAERAAQTLKQLYPALTIAGIEEPPFRELMPHEDAELAMRVRDAKPDILLVALGQPKGEQWIARWYQQMQVPVSVQLGGSFNFVTGQVRRSPRWVAVLGMEWAWRLYCEPRRLFLRYLSNTRFLCGAILRDLYKWFSCR